VTVVPNLTAILAGAVIVAVVILAVAVKRLANALTLLRIDLGRSTDNLKDQIIRLKSETREEREEREQQEAERRRRAAEEAHKREQQRLEREARERERREQEPAAHGSAISAADEDDYCRCASPGDACTWK